MSPPLRVALPGPLDVPASLERFRRWGDDLLERWDGETFVATAPLAGGALAFATRSIGDVERPLLEVTLEAARLKGGAADIPGTSAAEVASHLGAIFVTGSAALERLMARDPIVAALEARYRGLRPVLQRDPLTALVRSISAQQVNLAWASITRRRLAESFGREHVVAGRRVMSLPVSRLAAASVSDLRALQFTAAKSASIVAVAAAVADGGYSLEELAGLPDEAVEARLVALRGIGRWTAEWFLARTLGRPRVVAGDLGVRKAIAAAYLPGPTPHDGSDPRRRALPDEATVRLATAHWGEAAGVAQQLALHWLGEGLPPLDRVPSPGDV